ncbi:MAG TPA: hypothetical protein VNO30_38605 [Kofleriaceae bacterium]|nr:hypothetical protein [Kofleriaceae bacterium]
MATAPPLARAYEALRPKILQRLLERRSAIDPGLGRLDEAAARAQIGAVLEHMGNFIAAGDLRMHRAFLQTFLAMRAAEAQSPASALATLVAIGDTAVQVAQDQAGVAAQGAELTLMLTRVTASTARALNDLIAEELESRRRTWRDMSAHVPPGRTQS